MTFKKKPKRELPEWKKELFSHWESKPSKADRAEFPVKVIKAAIERSGGICEYCRQRPCTSTHHILGRNRSGRGVLSNAYRVCGICHLEIEGSEEKKQELIALYTRRYGERFWYDETDWDEYNRRQAAEQEAEEAKRQRLDALQPIVDLLSTAAGRKLNSKEIRLISAMDERETEVFANLLHDVVGGGMTPEQKSYGYGHFDD